MKVNEAKRIIAFDLLNLVSKYMRPNMKAKDSILITQKSKGSLIVNVKIFDIDDYEWESEFSDGGGTVLYFWINVGAKITCTKYRVGHGVIHNYGNPLSVQEVFPPVPDKILNGNKMQLHKFFNENTSEIIKLVEETLKEGNTHVEEKI